MNLFERITNQMLVECEDSNVEWAQTWYNVIPKDAKPPLRTDEERECYDMAWDIVFDYTKRVSLDCIAYEECATATYNFKDDQVKVPCIEQFDCDADFFSTLFHELVHSTGHEKRLKRPGFNPECKHGEYCQEELIAELGAMYLCGICCYNEGKNFERSSSYIRGYKSQTHSTDEDLRIIARMAQKAVDYIIGED